jgi:hypothetical protein
MSVVVEYPNCNANNASSTMKIGRNDPCPCKSGKKYKRCCLNMAALRNVDRTDLAEERTRAAEIQRQRQQGLGRPILSATVNGRRVIAVRGRLFETESFRTFHDFLMRYISVTLGVDWGNAELKKPVGQRHPLLQWYDALCRHQRKFMTSSGHVQGVPQSGAFAAYLHLAYDLYALDHNVELQERLLKRLRHRHTFTGARYETYVAATFIRAGFDLVFEDEEDGSTSHCEFVATYRPTGRRFSVEAKRRESERMRLGRLFNGALAKAAAYDRIIFMDVNTRDDDPSSERPLFLRALRSRMRRMEDQLLNGQPSPAAYVMLTNTPWEHYLEEPAPRCTVLAEGFKIPEFKEDRSFPSLRAAIDARSRHAEMWGLLHSIRDHSEIPSTFDGDLPAYAFGDAPARILVGQRYMVPTASGPEHPAVVTTACVAESESTAYCGVSFDHGGVGLWKVPLSAEEMEVWRRHPDTFFGVVDQRTTKAETALDLYDFILASFSRLTKEQLLKAVGEYRDYSTVKDLSQPELASIHAECLTNGAIAQGWRTKPPPSE